MFKSAAKSHIGYVRSCNEDSFIENIELGLWLVADGVGGNAHGDFASQVVAQTVERKIRLGSSLKEAVEDAHLTIIKLGQDKSDLAGMASTVVAVHFKGTHYEICWVGDSRVYLINQKDGIRQLTVDHNQAQVLVDTGEISIEEARLHPSQRMLMHAVGINDADWNVDQLEGELCAGDKLLLCSDGLSGELQDSEILASFDQGKPLKLTVEELLEKALGKGGSDNITLAIIELDRYGVNASELDKLSDQKETTVNQTVSITKPKSAFKYMVLGVVAALAVVTIAVWMA